MQNAKLAANGLTPTINQHGVLYGIAPEVWMESCGAEMESARSAVWKRAEGVDGILRSRNGISTECCIERVEHCIIDKGLYL